MTVLAELTILATAVTSVGETPDAAAMLVRVLEEVRSNVAGAVVIALAIAANTPAVVAAEGSAPPTAAAS